MLLKKVSQNLNDGRAAIPTSSVCAIETASEESHPKEVVWDFILCEMEPCSHPKWGFWEKPQNPEPPAQSLVCFCAKQPVFAFSFPRKLSAAGLEHPPGRAPLILPSEGSFMPHHCYLRRGSLLSSGEQFSCITLAVAASKWIFILRKSC